MRMTDEQRDKKGAERRERERAWRARYKERAAAEETMKAKTAAWFDPEYAAATALLDAVFDDERVIVQHLERQIAELRERINVLRAHYIDQRKGAHDAIRALADRHMVELKAIEDALDEQFPDMKGEARWSPAVWERRRKGCA